MIDTNPELNLTEAIELLGDDYTYGEVRIMMADRFHKKSATEQKRN